MFKKFISTFLCFVTVFTVTAAAFIKDGGITAEAASYSLPYYCNQLSSEAKEFYICLREAIMEHKTKIRLDMDFDKEELGMIAELLVLHDPLTFNIEDVTYRSTSKRSAVFEPKYKYSKETYNKMVTEYDKKAKNILSKLTDDMSDYKKIKTIHDYIIKNTEYDLDSKNNDNIYGTLVKNKAKCDGYARTFVYICGKAGIRAVTVAGDDLSEASSDNGHMWNKVYYNKKWYNVDVTWDDPTSNMKDNLQYDYFMVSDKALSKTHKEENLSFKVPKATDNSQNYFTVNKLAAATGDEAVALFEKELKKAVKNGKNHISIKCTSQEALNRMRNYLTKDDTIYTYLKKLNNNTNDDLVTALIYYNIDPNVMTVRLNFFYRNTDFDDYFSKDADISSNARKSLERYGIK